MLDCRPPVYAAMLEARMQRTLRLAVVEKYLDVPLSFYQEHPTGELLAHADADVIGTTTSIKPLPFSIGVVFLAVFALIGLARIDWAFALVALVLFPALAIINRVYTSRVHIPSPNSNAGSARCRPSPTRASTGRSS